MNNLLTRALTGAIYVALTLGAALAGPWTVFLLFLPVCAIAAHEMHRLVRSDDEGTGQGWSIGLALVMYAGLSMAALHPAWTVTHGLTAVFVTLLAAIAAMVVRGPADPARAIGGLLVVAVLTGVPFGVLPHLHVRDPWLFIGFMLLLWTNDTGAYLSGRAFGRRKLLPAVSPNKTVEGLIGGVLLTVAVAAALSEAGGSRFQPVPGLFQWLACGAIVALASTLGDLLESALKRARGVKDSGTVLPGHGGVLDRFDGLLLAAPAMLLYLLVA